MAKYKIPKLNGETRKQYITRMALLTGENYHNQVSICGNPAVKHGYLTFDGTLSADQITETGAEEVSE